MTMLFNPPKPSYTPTVAPAPQKSDAEVQQAASDERSRLAAAQGRQSTLLVSPTDTAAAPALKTLLGA